MPYVGSIRSSLNYLRTDRQYNYTQCHILRRDDSRKRMRLGRHCRQHRATRGEWRCQLMIHFHVSRPLLGRTVHTTTYQTRATDRQTDRQTVEHTDRWTDIRIHTRTHISWQLTDGENERTKLTSSVTIILTYEVFAITRLMIEEFLKRYHSRI